MELDLRDINTMLTDAGIRDGEVMGVTGAGFVRVLLALAGLLTMIIPARRKART